MKRVVSPPRESLNKLRQPMTKGERAVFEFFDNNLALDWEIYIQPHMNGLRPDFVLLNPKVGMAVFEVKDWDLDALNYRVITRAGKSPLLEAEKDGTFFSKQSDNPIEKVYRYKNELYSLYCPRLKQGNGFATITAGVIFPCADDDRVKKLFSPSINFRGMDKFAMYNPVSGRKALNIGDIDAIFPEGKRVYSQYMTDELASDLRYWLVEPDFAATQRTPIELDANQRSLVTTRTKTGYRRIKGAAGSGKSLVLAARAAELLNQGKTVLVVTFNITLLHYLMDISVRWPRTQGNTRSGITWLNFHAWCKRVCIDADCEQEYKLIWSDTAENSVLNQGLPALVSRIIDNDDTQMVPCYDAILVDEGQDFLPNWWDVLRKVCKPGGEMLLVADSTQDIYDTAGSWTDEVMNGAGFTGDWAQLPTSYRMPKEALEKAKEFAIRYLPNDKTTLPNNNQGSLALEPCQLRWVQVDQVDAVKSSCDEIFRIFNLNVPDLAISDLTFLCVNKDFGLDVVKALGQKGIKVVHTYDPDREESRRQKVGFYMGDARVKATTLHSFKGWESRLLIIYIGESVSDKNLALIYTGLTRIKRSVDGSCLTIISSAHELLEYGKKWPSFENNVNVTLLSTVSLM